MRFFLHTLIWVLIPISLYAQEFEESFDGVAVPNLPAGWSSSTPMGTGSWTTTGVFSYTSPNSAKAPVPASASDVQLLSPVISFPGAIAPVGATLTFFHRYEITDVSSGTNTYDGAVIEVSINGGAFKDILDVGGSFVSGGYTHTVNISTNALNGRQVWAGTQTVFTEVEVRLPNIPVGGNIRLRFRIGSDSIIGSAGWYIDLVRVTPDVDVSIALTPSDTEIILGSEVEFQGVITNHSTLPVNELVGLIHSGTNPTLSYNAPPPAVATSPDGFVGSISFPTPIAPGATSNFSFKVKSQTPSVASGMFTIVAPSDIAGNPVLLVPATFSPETSPAGITAQIVGAEDSVGSPYDICQPVSNVSEVAGKIAVISTDSGCSIMTKALNAQAAGALAVIIEVSSFIMPPFNEPTDPNLTIPVVSASELTFSSLLFPIIGPYLSDLQINLLVRRDKLAVQALVFPTAGRETFTGDNNTVVLINQSQDSDGDGVGDNSDACPTDNQKLAPGQCGCGVAETDMNSNGIVDCLRNKDFLERIKLLKSKLKKIDGSGSKNEKKIKKEIKKLNLEIKSVTETSSAELILVSSGIDIKKLGSNVKKEVSALLKSASSEQRKKANKALNKLIKSLVAN